MAGAHEPASHAGGAGAAEGVDSDIPPPPDAVRARTETGSGCLRRKEQCRRGWRRR